MSIRILYILAISDFLLKWLLIFGNTSGVGRVLNTNLSSNFMFIFGLAVSIALTAFFVMFYRSRHAHKKFEKLLRNFLGIYLVLNVVFYLMCLIGIILSPPDGWTK